MSDFESDISTLFDRCEVTSKKFCHKSTQTNEDKIKPVAICEPIVQQNNSLVADQLQTINRSDTRQYSRNAFRRVRTVGRVRYFYGRGRQRPAILDDDELNTQQAEATEHREVERVRFYQSID